MNATRIELLDPERVILDEIANRAMTRADVAQTYAMLIRQADETCDWRRINEAIIRRWSRSALEYIKRRAWKLVGGATV